jgi:hypothetical protein
MNQLAHDGNNWMFEQWLRLQGLCGQNTGKASGTLRKKQALRIVTE